MPRTRGIIPNPPRFEPQSKFNFSAIGFSYLVSLVATDLVFDFYDAKDDPQAYIEFYILQFHALQTFPLCLRVLLGIFLAGVPVYLKLSNKTATTRNYLTTATCGILIPIAMFVYREAGESFFLYFSVLSFFFLLLSEVKF
jgi:hypothetical protein